MMRELVARRVKYIFPSSCVKKLLSWETISFRVGAKDVFKAIVSIVSAFISGLLRCQANKEVAIIKLVDKTVFMGSY